MGDESSENTVLSRPLRCEFNVLSKPDGSAVLAQGKLFNNNNRRVIVHTFVRRHYLAPAATKFTKMAFLCYLYVYYSPK